MKNVKTPFGLRKEVVTIISIGFGAIMGGLLSAIGQNAGEYRGITETFEKCKAAVDETFEQYRNKSEEEKTE
nr:MAG TPA: YtxH-like protein [Caudoviricetes sp.]